MPYGLSVFAEPKRPTIAVDAQDIAIKGYDPALNLLCRPKPGD
jgi:hypothetical protein